MQVEADALLAHVEAILARGVAVDTVLVDLLAPTARLLGEFWEDDRCDFVDVTMGLWRLAGSGPRDCRRVCPPTERTAGGGHRALFASMPGDQHNFGTVVIDELFRRDGWLTDRLSEAETLRSARARRRRLVRHDRIDGQLRLPYRARCPRSLLRCGTFRAIRGSASWSAAGFSARIPILPLQVGADGTARDAKLALKVAGELVREREREAALCN